MCVCDRQRSIGEERPVKKGLVLGIEKKQRPITKNRGLKIGIKKNRGLLGSRAKKKGVYI